MLQSLYIDNYALIENLKIDLKSGFSIITGETGAGKSILLGALSLIIGKRADTGILYDRDKKCIVEAVFAIKDYGLNNFFENNDIDFENHVTIRREINPAGKSRAFINDTPVNLETLNELTNKLIDIHSQHENLSLNDNRFQLNVIDLYGNHHQLLTDYFGTYTNYLSLKKEHAETIKTLEKIKSDYDYIQFQYDQLDQAKLKPNELEELEQELERLNHAEEIKVNFEGASSLLLNEDSLITRIKTLLGFMSKVRKFVPEAEEIGKRIDNCFIELKDISSEIDNINSRLSLDPQRQEQVSQRLDMLYGLLQKHNVKTIDELINIRTDFERKLETVSGSDLKLEELEKKLKKISDDLEKSAELLSENRKSKFIEIEKQVTTQLFDLGIPNANFKIECSELAEFCENGKDLIQFMFSANKNVPVQEISKVASGGELSRFMLCIKSLIANSAGLPTIIFDEVDMGVSGEVADKVGNIIKKMSEGMQVINITHLPQIAGKGDHHFLVYKKDNETSTKTYIKLLTLEERVTEIAKMLSGKELTDAALKNARELLNA